MERIKFNAQERFATVEIERYLLPMAICSPFDHLYQAVSGFSGHSALSPHTFLKTVAAGEVAVEVEDDDGGETPALPVRFVKAAKQLFPSPCRVRYQDAVANEGLPVDLGEGPSCLSDHGLLRDAQHSSTPGGVKDEVAGCVGTRVDFKVSGKAHLVNYGGEIDLPLPL